MRLINIASAVTAASVFMGLGSPVGKSLPRSERGGEGERVGVWRLEPVRCAGGEVCG